MPNSKENFKRINRILKFCGLKSSTDDAQRREMRLKWQSLAMLPANAQSAAEEFPAQTATFTGHLGKILFITTTTIII